MNDPIVEYPAIIKTPYFFQKAILKTKIAWMSWVFFFVTTYLLAYLFDCQNDECDAEIAIFFLNCSFVAYLSSLGGFINIIESFKKKEEVSSIRFFLLVANFLIFGSITIVAIYFLLSII